MDLPELTNRLIASNLNEADKLNAAFAVHKKRGKEPQVYRTRVEPMQDGGYTVVATDSLKALGKRNLASVQSQNKDRRLAAQQLIEANPFYNEDQAALKYGTINQLKGKEVHHLTEIDTFIRALRSASPQAQIAGISALLADGFRFGDHKANQIALWGDPINVPGPKTRAGEKVIPANHPGVGEHQTNGGVHQRVDEIAATFGFPDTNKLEVLERFIEKLPEQQQGAAIEALGHMHRKGIQDVKGVTAANIPAATRTTVMMEDAMARTFLPLRAELQALADAHSEQMIRAARRR